MEQSRRDDNMRPFLELVSLLDESAGSGDVVSLAIEVGDALKELCSRSASGSTNVLRKWVEEGEKFVVESAGVFQLATVS